MGLKKLLRNLRYLSKVDLSKIDLHTELDNIYYCINHIKYEVEQDMKRIKIPRVHYHDETVEKLISSNCSIARFGDGELNLLCGTSIPCQHADNRIKEKLAQVLEANDDNFMQGIPDIFRTCGSGLEGEKVHRIFFARIHDEFVSHLDLDKDYYYAGATFPYVNSRGSDFAKVQETYDKIISIWKDKDIAIICGDRVFDYIKVNIFDFAKSVEYIYGPTNDAFDKYDELYQRACQIDKNKIVIILLGPTATVLAYDLHKLGYRALDLGHIAKDYDAFKREMSCTGDNVAKFFEKE